MLDKVWLEIGACVAADISVTTFVPGAHSFLANAFAGTAATGGAAASVAHVGCHFHGAELVCH